MTNKYVISKNCKINSKEFMWERLKYDKIRFFPHRSYHTHVVGDVYPSIDFDSHVIKNNSKGLYIGYIYHD